MTWFAMKCRTVLRVALADAARHARERFASLCQRHLTADELAVGREDVGVQVPFVRSGIQPVGIPDGELLDFDDVQRAERGRPGARLLGVAARGQQGQAERDGGKRPGHLEVELHADLEQARVENARGTCQAA